MDETLFKQKLLKEMLRFIHIKMSTDLCEIEEIGDHLHEREHADTGGDGGDAGVHVPYIERLELKTFPSPSLPQFKTIISSI